LQEHGLRASLVEGFKLPWIARCELRKIFTVEAIAVQVTRPEQILKPKLLRDTGSMTQIEGSLRLSQKQFLKNQIQLYEICSGAHFRALSLQKSAVLHLQGI